MRGGYKRGGYSRWDDVPPPRQPKIPYHQIDHFQNYQAHNQFHTDQMFQSAYVSGRNGHFYGNTNYYSDQYMNGNFHHGGGDSINYSNTVFDQGWNIRNDGMRNIVYNNEGGRRQEREETVPSHNQKRMENQNKGKKAQSTSTSLKNEEAQRKLLSNEEGKNKLPSHEEAKRKPPSNEEARRKLLSNEEAKRKPLSNEEAKRKLLSNEEAKRKLISNDKFSNDKSKRLQNGSLRDTDSSRPNTNRKDQYPQNYQNKKGFGKYPNEKFTPILEKEQNKQNKKGLLGPPPDVNSKYRPYRGEHVRINRYIDEEEDESNEISSWLQQSKGKETVNGKAMSPVSTEPLPGSEEARTNSVNELRDRVKQSLLQNKNNVNVKELLSSGDESKSENLAHSKLKTYPKNLAQLELDASDMREIGRANTDKTNCLVDENSDDDIVEVQRPPPPPRPVIDLDVSPMKDGQSRNTSIDSSDSEEEVPHTEILNNSMERSKGSKGLGIENDEASSEVNGDNTPTNNKESHGGNDVLTPKINQQVTNISSFHEILSQRNREDTVTSSGRVSLFRRISTENEKTTLSSLGVTSPTNSNQHRRRESSSSSCTIPSPVSLRNTRPQHQNSDNFIPRSPPVRLQSNHNLRQKKIISGLQKIDRSKLKDLINNPRSGKLDCVMRDLMKDYRAAVSRETRDVAEKSIPAEVLNPKSTELPVDDNILLADFNIDWSSLPGEIISTLGDLFQVQELDSESEEGVASTQSPSSNQAISGVPLNADYAIEGTAESINLSEDCLFHMSVKDELSSNDIQQPVSGEQDDMRLVDSTIREVADQDLEGFSENVPFSAPAKIRVRQFARENNLDEEDSVRSQHFRGSLTEQSGSLELDGEAVHFDGRVNSSTATLMENANTDEEINSSSKTRTSNSPCYQQRSNADNSHRKNCVHIQDRSSVRKKTPEKESKKASATHEKESKTVKGKNKQRKFVRLEERSWFQEAPSKKSIKDNSDSSIRTESANSKTNSEADLVIANASNNETNQSEITNVTSNQQTEKCQATNEITSTCNVETNSSNVSRAISHSSVANDLLSANGDSVSMLPVLMMTVSANALSNTVCNMSATAMQKRITEIDAQLQNLVQERFLLSQALKVAQTVPENVSSSIEESPDVNEGMPSNLLSRTDEDRTSLRSSEEANVKWGNASSSKRKRNDYEPGDERHPKKGKSKDNIPNSTGGVKNMTVSGNQKKDNNVKDCYVHLEPISPNTLISKLGKNRKESEVIVIEDDDKNCSNSCVNGNAHVPPQHAGPENFFRFQGIEGTVLDVKLDNYQYFFASSQNGQVFMVSHSSKKVEAVFGEKNPYGVTSIELVKPYNLYTASGDGVLRIYDYQDRVSKSHAMSTHNISSGIHCMEANWDYVYIGTRTGSVIPFNSKTLLAGEALTLGGYPVLSIKTSMEGPRKVLIVASRNQPIAIRDAISGLLLRSIGGCDWTVYSMQLEKSQVFCGTTSDKISVFDFQSGDLKYELQAGKGVVAIQVHESGLLFCACYDGKIYVFDPQARKLVTSFDGPGKMSLCLNVCKRKIICSSKDKPLTCYNFPSKIKWYLKGHMKSLAAKPKKSKKECTPERKKVKEYKREEKKKRKEKKQAQRQNQSKN